MTERTLKTGARAAALAFVAAGALGLAACEEHAYPSAAPREATSAPPPPDAPLAGAPTTRSPEYVTPPPGPAEGYAPPPPGYGPPPPGMDGRPPAPGYGRPLSGPPEIVTMAPIPNPPERPRTAWRHEHWRHEHWRREGYGRVYPAPAPYWSHPYPHHHHHAGRMAPAYAIAPHHVVRPATPVRHAAPVHHPAPAPHHPAPVAPATPGAQLPKPAAPEHGRHHHHAVAGAAAGAATAAAASGGSTRTSAEANTTGNTTVGASEADRYQALQQALKDDFASAAELKAPAHMEANQQATVTLTLPADFAQTVHNEAAKQNLGDAVGSMNLVATLTGDGYTIVPEQAQTLPLASGAATTFTWKVTPTGSGRSPLKASVRADAVGAGHDLDLGSKSTGSGSATGRVVGIGLLALIALVLLGWAAQRRRPTPSGATKPRSTHTNGTNP